MSSGFFLHSNPTSVWNADDFSLFEGCIICPNNCVVCFPMFKWMCWIYSYAVIKRDPLYLVLNVFTLFLFIPNFNNFLLQLCSNWQHFYDPESGISTYYIGVSSVYNVNVTDIANLTEVGRRLHKTCVPVDPTHPLEHGKTYYTIVWMIGVLWTLSVLEDPRSLYSIWYPIFLE
jgi:hypothetical protein